MLKDFAESTPAQGDALGKTLKDAATAVTAKAEAAGSNVLAWFNTIMDRTTERFVIHTRVVTAFFAFGLAFALHIDTMHIVAQLSSKPEVRAAVVNSALKSEVPQYEEMQKTDPLPVETIHALAKNNPAAGRQSAGRCSLSGRGPTEGPGSTRPFRTPPRRQNCSAITRTVR